MLATEIKGFLTKRPFDPFRIHLSSGETVDVKHPEMALVTRTMVGIGVGGRASVADHLVSYNMLHIVKVEPLIRNGRPRARTQRRRG